MPRVKIISTQPQRYNTQGFGLPVEYQPGEFYEVPDHVARGLMDPSRNWARLAKDEEIPAAEAQAPASPLAPGAAMPVQPDQAQSVDPPPTEPPQVEEAEPASHPASPAGRRSRK